MYGSRFVIHLDVIASRRDASGRDPLVHDIVIQYDEEYDDDDNDDKLAVVIDENRDANAGGGDGGGERARAASASSIKSSGSALHDEVH